MPNIDCDIHHPDGSNERGTFTIMECLGERAELHSYFLTVVEALVKCMESNPTAADVIWAVERLSELLSALTLAPRKSTQGLWAELLVIACSSDVGTTAEAWHAHPNEHFDFVKGPHKLEVKSSSSGKRHHHFSFEQLSPPSNTTVVIASILVEKTGGGLSLRDLIDAVRRHAQRAARLVPHIDHVISMSLGNSWADALEARFDFEKAHSSLSLYRADTIPKIPSPMPTGIIRADFVSDLSNCPQLSSSELEAYGGLFRAANPRHIGSLFT